MCQSHPPTSLRHPNAVRRSPLEPRLRRMPGQLSCRCRWMPRLSAPSCRASRTGPTRSFVIPFRATQGRYLMESHAEMRSMNCRNGFQWSAHFDPRYGSASKDVQQQLAGRSGQASRRLA
ncbi:hypothetical protein BN9982_200019 [Mycobacterium tuberculosis]|nr:hypothetical protein BN9982_200019 [Mycobacterium tuberculosis]